jgi:hypothetical protein
MYEKKAGFKRLATFDGWPEGHFNVILCKHVDDGRREAVEPDPSPIKASLSRRGIRSRWQLFRGSVILKVGCHTC